MFVWVEVSIKLENRFENFRTQVINFRKPWMDTHNFSSTTINRFVFAGKLLLILNNYWQEIFVVYRVLFSNRSISSDF